jgi:phosphate transporter
VNAIKHALPHSRLSAAAELFFMACIMATFVSHSVAAIVVVPVIAHIGKSYGAVQEFAFGTALAISAAMALPFSSFPNVYCLLVIGESASGERVAPTPTIHSRRTLTILFCAR